jgi:signal transduction histidine kinase
MVDNAEYFQGFLCDWPVLRTALLSEVTDLVARAALTPIVGATPDERAWGSRLATVPVSLSVGQLAVASASVFTPVRVTIGVAWLVVLLGMTAVAATLRQSISFGEKRSRFATAVTHELRTPLTTFRMYTEMLADGMIQDEQQRQTYLTTLKDESGRLASLVENVLSYARLEEGRRVGKQEDISVGELIQRVKPLLERRVADAGMTLECETSLPLETVVHTDSESYNQIVFNLIDNACKYASDAKDLSIHLRIAQDEGRLTTTVCDHGSGITADRARMIFEPFERGSFGASDKPGIGLGLALSRRLARDLGGDLVCKPAHECGACFELVLPIGLGR